MNAASGLAGIPDALRVLLAVASDAPAPVVDEMTWTQVPALARAHRMQGLLHRAMPSDAAWRVPDAVRQEVAADALAVAQQSLLRVSALAALCDAAASRGIPLLPYKGPVLSMLAYGAVGLRPAADVDVVIPRAHRARAAEMMIASGYRPTTTLPVPLHERLHAHLGASPWSGENGLVELHWRLCEVGLPWSMDASELLARATTVPLAGRSMPVPSPDDLLLQLAWHGGRHAWEQLEWLAAVAALVRARQPDWPALTARAVAYGGRRPVVLMQSLLAEWLGAAPAPRAEPWLVQARAQVAAQYVRQRTLFVEDRRAYRRFLRLLLDRPSDRIRLAASQLMLPTEADARAVQLPAALWPLYVPLRLLRLGLRAVGIGRQGESPS